MPPPEQQSPTLQIRSIITVRPVRFNKPKAGAVYTNLIHVKTNTIIPQNKNIKCGLLNIRSLLKKGVLVNELISDNCIDLLFLNETWLKEQEYESLNTATPPSHTNTHIPRITDTTGGGVAAIFNSSLVVSLKTNRAYNTFESLTLSLSHPNWKSKQPILLVTVYRPPTPAYTPFLSEFSEFLSSLVLDSNKIILCGDMNVHVDVATNSLSSAFIN